MKKILRISEQTTPMDDRAIIKKGIESGCIPNNLKDGSFGTYQGKFVYFGQNQKGNTLIFYPDGKVTHLEKNETRVWYDDNKPCPGLKQTVGTEPELSSFTPDQQKYIDDIISKEGVQLKKPSDYETERKKWDVIDLNSRNSTLFPEKGKYIVYKQKGEINVTKPQQENIISALEGRGFLRDEPPANESEKYIKINLQVIENRKYLPYFKEAPFYMWQPVENVDMSSLLQDVKNKFDAQKVNKKQCRQIIDILYTAFKKDYKLEDSERVAYKNYASRCDSQKSFMFATKKKLDFLKTINPRHKSKLSLNLKNESENKLESIIKENLIELSKNKNKILNEEKTIVETRFNFILENVDLKTKKGQIKFCDDLISEIFYLQNQGFSQEIISEQTTGIWDIVKGLFGHSGEGITQLFKSRFIEWIMDKFLPEGFGSKSILGGIFVNALSNTPIGDIPKLTECGYLTKALSKAIVEEIPKQLQHKTGVEGGIYEIIRNSLIETLSSSDWGERIQNSLVSLVCPSLQGIKEKMNIAGSQMKEKALQPT